MGWRWKQECEDFTLIETLATAFHEVKFNFCVEMQLKAAVRDGFCLIFTSVVVPKADNNNNNNNSVNFPLSTWLMQKQSNVYIFCTHKLKHQG